MVKASEIPRASKLVSDHMKKTGLSEELQKSPNRKYAYAELMRRKLKRKADRAREKYMQSRGTPREDRMSDAYIIAEMSRRKMTGLVAKRKKAYELSIQVEPPKVTQTTQVPDFSHVKGLLSRFGDVVDRMDALVDDDDEPQMDYSEEALEQLDNDELIDLAKELHHKSKPKKKSYDLDAMLKQSRAKYNPVSL